MKIVGTDDSEVERGLVSGELVCPGCGGRLAPWGSARWRVLRCRGGDLRRRPRRSRCVACGVSHVLLGADCLLRRRDAVDVIGAALVAKATGLGHRQAAALVVGVPVSTVRGWLRRFAVNAEQIRVWFTVLAHGLDPLLAPLAPTGTPVGDAVEAVGVAARAASLRLAPLQPWLFASEASRGRFLSNTGWPWAAPV